MKIETEEFDETVITLDPYNSDLNLVLDASRYSAQPLTNEGFAFMWAGARATHGFSKGQICYEVKILDYLDVSHLPDDEPNPHVVRVGFSVESSTLQLGEDPLSYGYGGTGKISTNCQFKDFGGPFQSGDVILGVLNMDTDPVQIGFAKNGKFLGWAYKVNKSELNDQALFPHILTKNTAFEVNFGQKDNPYFTLPDIIKDFVFASCTPIEQRISGTRPPKRKEDCEMIMMCGLPGAGKSVWAADYSSKHPEKKYNVLGTNNIIDKMKVMGLPRKRNYAGRWDVLIQMATKCLNKMFEIGSKVRRNYILDQTNVYPNAQRRKMKNFKGFKRIAVVVVPSEEEYKRRCDKRDREEGKEVPDSAVNEMKANFKMPSENDIFDEIIFTELQRDEADKLVRIYNEDGRAATGPPRKQFHGSNFGNRGFDSNRGSFNSNRSVPERGSYAGRGSYDSGRGGFGGSNYGSYGGNSGGFGNNQGNFEGGRSYDGGHGGYDNRGGFEQRNYDNRGGRDNERSFNSGRGGYQGNRGYEEGRGRKREAESSGSYGYGGNSESSYRGYEENTSGFGSNRGFGPSKGGRGRGDFSGSRSSGNQGGYGRNDNANDQFSSGNMRGGYDRGDSSIGRGSRGFRGGQSRGSSYSGNNNSRGNNSINRGYGHGGYNTNDFGRDSTSSYGGGFGDYQSDYNNQSQGGYREGSDVHSRRDTTYGPGPQGGFKKEPGTESGGYNSGNRIARGASRPSGRTTTRWSAVETPETYPQRSAPSQEAVPYPRHGAQIKTEPPSHPRANKYDNYSGQSSSYGNYGSNNQPSPAYNTQSYGYQQNAPANVAPQPWSSAQAPPPSIPAGQGVADQSQWSQYYPQQSQPNQYYNRYEPPASGTQSMYGSTYSK